MLKCICWRRVMLVVCQRTSYRRGQKWKAKGNGREGTDSKNGFVWLKKFLVRCCNACGCFTLCMKLSTIYCAECIPVLQHNNPVSLSFIYCYVFFSFQNVLWRKCHWCKDYVPYIQHSRIFLDATSSHITDGTRFHVPTPMGLKILVKVKVVVWVIILKN